MKLRLAVLSSLLAVVAFAADATGTWTAEQTSPNGQKRTSTLTLKVEGAKLTGTVSGRGGDTPLTDSKVDGDTITFTIVREFQGNSMKINYTGKVSSDEIKFKSQVEGGDRPAQEFTAKRSAN